MKNRITTPEGNRIIVDAVVNYWDEGLNAVAIKSASLYSVGSGADINDIEFKSTTYHLFPSIEERGAFLARLDNYFQEIP